MGDQAAFLSAGGYHHHIGLNTWESKGGSPPPPGTTGLYHVAIRFPDRPALARTLKRVLEAGIRIGASDHGVSEAIYFEDPDGNGIEIYRDRPQEEWPRAPDGSIAMMRAPLDLEGLLAEALLTRCYTSGAGYEPKPVEQLDRVVIRFAGDSGDGMQLTGARFTSETAVLGNDLSTLPDFPAEIRAPAGSLAGRLGLPDPLLRPRHPHAGRPAERARRDEPGGAPDEHPRPAERRHADRQPRRLHGAQPREGGLHGEPARRRLARRVPRPRGAADVADARGAEGGGLDQARGRALEEHVRARAHVLALPPAGRGHDRVPGEEVQGAPGDRRGEREGVQGRLGLRRDERGLRGQLRGRAGQAAARHVPQHPRQPGARARADRREREERPAAVPRRLSDHAGLGDPRGPLAPQGVRCPDVPGRGRDRRGRGCAGGELRWGARGLHVERSGRRPEDGDDRPRRHARAAAADPRHPARRPVHGHADEA